MHQQARALQGLLQGLGRALFCRQGWGTPACCAARRSLAARAGDTT